MARSESGYAADDSYSLGFKVEEALDHYIESISENRPPDGKYHPSSLFGCTRKVVYTLRDTVRTETTEAAALRRFYIGHRLHEAVQEAIALAPNVDAFYPEIELDTEQLNISGHGDGLLRLKDGRYVLVEIKSIRKSAFRWGLRQDNVKQAMTYAYIMRTFGGRALSMVTGLTEDIPPLGDKLVGLLIVYLEKEDLAMREHFIHWDPKMGVEVAEKIDELDSYRFDPNSLPPRLKLDKNGKKNWQCRFCPFQRLCWEEDPDEVKPMEVVNGAS